MESFDRERNLLTVEWAGGEKLTYDPRLQGVTVYRDSERTFGEGDRVQFTEPDKTLKIANREVGTIEGIDERGNVAVKLDSGREIRFNLEENRHLDYGCAVTSHSSQAATAERVLMHVDTEQAGEQLVNRRLAYVAVSRARYDAQIYTNDAGNLGKVLSREVSHARAFAWGGDDKSKGAGSGDHSGEGGERPQLRARPRRRGEPRARNGDEALNSTFPCNLPRRAQSRRGGSSSGAGFSAAAGIPMTATLLEQAMQLFRTECPGVFERVQNYAQIALGLGESEPDYNMLLSAA